MKKRALIIALAIPILTVGQSIDQNYIRTKTYKEPTSSTIADPSQEEAAQKITYYDGLGRPIQQIAYKQSGAGNDIVTHIAYDEFGRQIKEYLPITDGQSLNYHSVDEAAVIGYYTAPAFAGLEVTGFPYSEKLIEASPLNRVLMQAAPGDDWKMTGGHEVKFDYQTNAANEVRVFGVNTAGLVDNSLYYDKFKLYKTITKDENWTSGNNNTTQEFKDFEGRIILKRTFSDYIVNGVVTATEVAHDTYYVYDDYGNLSYVIPPLVNLSAAVSSTVLDDLCYQYRYDDRNRLIHKKLPGKQWEYIAYNSQDLPVATGPAKNPWGENSWGWMITKYDIFGRIVYTGWYETDVNELERKTFEDDLITDWSESFKDSVSTIDGITISYTSDISPRELKLLTINYYDSYGYTNGPTLPGNVEGETVSTNVKSLPTGTWVRVLNDPNNTDANVSYTLYDGKGRVIRSHKDNYLGGYTRVDTKLDFTGKPEYTFTYHKRDTNSTEIAIKDTYEDTAEGRPLTHIQKINGLANELISKNDYNELGQLISKEVGGQDVTTYAGLQKVDFSYNIRGWLTGINNDPANDGIINTTENDLFLFKINYNNVENDVSNNVKALYNGNISETFWRTSNDDILRKYGYQYDNMNRLINSFYQKPQNTMPVTNMYNEQLSYDKNGNIQTLHRNGDFDSDIYGAIEIDDLSYSYDPDKKNQLVKVTDATNSPKGFKDDSNGTNDTADDYGYDDNGNMTNDQNKGITEILYNHLNLPTQITFASGDEIKYLYDAAGQKVAKTVTVSSSDTVTDYLDGYQYTNSVLNFYPHAEGYVNVTYCPTCQTGSQQKFNYVYQYKDHLGNIRVSYGYDPKDEVIKIIEENHYYPFGLKHLKYNSGKYSYMPDEDNLELTQLKQVPAGVEVLNKYKYNGKEYQDELGLNEYDYGWRNYMPDIGRWTQYDPLLNDLKFTHDVNEVDQDDQEAVYMAIVDDNEIGGGIYNTNNLNPYGYGYNNPVSFDDPDGRCPQCITAALGALIGGGIELGGQLLAGKSLSEVDWADVGVEALKGGLIGSGVGAGAAIGIEGAAIATKASIDISAKGGNQSIFNGKKSASSAIADGAIDLAAGAVGGVVGKKIGKMANAEVKAAAKAETSATKNITKATNSFNKITNGGKNMYGSKSMLAKNALDKAGGAAKVARATAVRAQMVKAAVNSPAGSVVNKAAQNSIGDRIKSFFGF